MKKNKITIIFALVLCLLLTGCGQKLLERSYSSVVPHSAAYWESGDADTLRAENYQELVNALLLLLDEHSEDGVVRIYSDAPDKSAMAGNACVEVQKETPIGAYLLDYITYNGKTESAYYELTVHFGYRRGAEEQEAIVNATSTEALPDLLRAAIEEGRGAVAIRVGYFGTDRDGVMALVNTVHDEVYPPPEEPAPEPETLPEDGTEPAGGADAADEAQTDLTPPEEPPQEPPEGEGTPEDGTEPTDGTGPEGEAQTEPEAPVYDVSPWEVLFYPDNDRPGIIEVILNENPDA
ncbi:MAG: hypothetical protein E7474_08840 [Ruminococcaceae bacterium]|nr:hypothetical protein [Oscillospiraceae bacterium]